MRFYLKLACISWCKKSVIMQPCFIFDVNAMGVPSEISLPTNKPDIRQNLWEEVRWSQIRLDQPLEQEGRKEIRLDQPSWGRLGWDSMLFYWIYHSITLNPIQDWSSLICFLPFFCSGTMNGDLLNLRPPPPHFPLIQSNEFMPEIQGKKRAPTGLPSRFQVSLHLSPSPPNSLKKELHSFLLFKWQT